MTRNTMIAFAAAALALGACSKEETPPPKAAVAAAPAPAAPKPAVVTAAPIPAPLPVAPSKPARQIPTTTRVNNVTLGSAIGPRNNLVNSTSTFGRGDTVYAIVSTFSNGRTPDTLTARWMYENSQLVSESSQKLPRGLMRSEFHVSKADGWPSGNYEVTFLVDDVPLKTAKFEVR